MSAFYDQRWDRAEAFCCQVFRELKICPQFDLGFLKEIACLYSIRILASLLK